MRCPACGHPDDRVVDSRSVQNATAIRRRRECDGCRTRFTTYERVEEAMAMIVKRDGRREAYNRDKLLRGVRIACRKRPVHTAEVDRLADSIERTLLSLSKREVNSRYIGDQVMEGLAQLDQVAYIRFASVYQSFEDIEQFTGLLAALRREQNDEPDVPPGASSSDA